MEIGEERALWELGAADVEGIESVRAIGSVLQEVFLRSRQFLPSLVLTETVPASADPCGLQCQNKIFIVLLIDERYQFPATRKCLVDFEVFLMMFHRVADIDILHAPTVSLKLVNNYQRKSCSLTA